MTNCHGNSAAFRLSGETLPLILRKKWNEQQSRPDDENDCSIEKREKEMLPLHPRPSPLEENVVFTADEIEQLISLASVNMIEMQKQLYRGEEMYHEETNSHGNLFVRWDAFVDTRDLTGSSSTQGTGSRRMPTDNRWFSGSCRSVLRSSKPTPVFVKGVTTPATPIPRSQTNTPVVLPPMPRATPSFVVPPPTNTLSSTASTESFLPVSLSTFATTPVSAPGSTTSNPHAVIEPVMPFPSTETSNLVISTVASMSILPEVVPSVEAHSPSHIIVVTTNSNVTIVPTTESPEGPSEIIASDVQSESTAATETQLRRNTTRKRKVGDA